MIDTIVKYSPFLFEALALLVGALAAGHAIMTKRDVRAAASWTAIVLLTPLIGAILYILFGINRVRIQRVLRRHNAAAAIVRSGYAAVGSGSVATPIVPTHLLPMKRLGDVVSDFSLLGGNQVRPLETGDGSYDAMLAAIDNAKNWVLLESYIFDLDEIGRHFIEHLLVACGRGIEVRVLVDAFGTRLSWPPVSNRLAEVGIPHAVFMGNVAGSHFRNFNLRTHRKILIVDGIVAFMGGMNIRAAFSKRAAGERVARDMHFEIKGPVVSDLAHVFAGDWLFATGELLPDEAIGSDGTDGTDGSESGVGVSARVVASGPDHEVECNHEMLVGILSIATRRVVIATPYFLPDRTLTSALAVAARRGVIVDIVMPSHSNHPLIDWAATAHLEEIVLTKCRIWRARGPFDHSKLMTVDSQWAYVGSSNLDPRSFRLNFEIDLEVYDQSLASWIENHIDLHIENADLVTSEGLARRKFWQKFRDRICWLASPYL